MAISGHHSKASLRNYIGHPSSEKIRACSDILFDTLSGTQWTSADLWLIKTRKFFHMTSRKQTVQGECFMNEQQPNSPEHDDHFGWQRHRTRLQWLMCPSTQRVGKDITASSYFFTRKAADLCIWGLLRCDDRRSPWWASCDGPHHDLCSRFNNVNQGAWHV